MRWKKSMQIIDAYYDVHLHIFMVSEGENMKRKQGREVSANEFHNLSMKVMGDVVDGKCTVRPFTCYDCPGWTATYSA